MVNVVFVSALKYVSSVSSCTYVSQLVETSTRVLVGLKRYILFFSTL